MHNNLHILLRCQQILTYILLFIEELVIFYACYHQIIELILFV